MSNPDTQNAFIKGKIMSVELKKSLRMKLRTSWLDSLTYHQQQGKAKDTVAKMGTMERLDTFLQQLCWNPREITRQSRELGCSLLGSSYQ